MNIIKYFHDDNDYPMTFEKRNGQVMVNATKMAKPFKKMVGHFLATNETKNMIKAIEDRYRNHDNGYKSIEVVKGGNDFNMQGTWMCEHLALRFASWLSPEFQLWVYDQIQELLTTGKVEIKTTEPLSLKDHIDQQIQKNNSIAVNTKAFVERDKNINARLGIIKYNRDSCKIHSGLTPSQLKFAGKKFGLKSKDRSSGKQVLRIIAPEVACQMSLTDYIISSSSEYSTEDIDKVYNNITKKAEDLYKAMLSNGINPPELEE